MAALEAAGEEPLPDDVGMLLESLVADDVEDRESDRRRHRIATERVEVLHPVRERAGDRSRRHDGTERMAVADRLAPRDDVRAGALRTERPDIRADAPESDLDLVGDRHGANAAGRVEKTGQPACGRDDLTGGGRDRLGDQRAGRVAR